MAGWVDEQDTVDNKVVIFKISMLLVNTMSTSGLCSSHAIIARFRP